MVDGVAVATGKPVIVAVGQTVSLKLRVKFPDGATADVTTDPISQYASTPKRGKFTGVGTWTALAADAGTDDDADGKLDAAQEPAAAGGHGEGDREGRAEDAAVGQGRPVVPRS